MYITKLKNEIAIQFKIVTFTVNIQCAKNGFPKNIFMRIHFT